MIKRLRLPILIGLGACLCSGFSPAQEIRDTVNINGHWSFTARIHSQCQFGGTAHLTQIEANKYAVELTAQQRCAYMEEDYLVRQDCAATRLGEQLSIRCTIKEFLNGYESELYYPDNFSLTIASSDRMHGALVSAGGFEPAEWNRSDGGIS